MMIQNFLEKESMAAHRKFRRLYLIALAVFIAAAAILSLLVGSEPLSFHDGTTLSVNTLLLGVAGFLLLLTLAVFLCTMQPAGNGKNLLLPLAETTREKAAEIINREVAEGNVLYEETLDVNTPIQHDTRVLLTPSYLLLVGYSMEKIRAIPRDRILWLSAQAGYKGGSYYARLIFFTQEKMLDCSVNDIELAKQIAEGLYAYIPNVFAALDWPDGMEERLPYVLEKLYQEDRNRFLALYEKAKAACKS